MRVLVSIVCFLFVLSSHAQELNANVVINHQKVQGSDDYIYDNMQRSIKEFLNNRKWTPDVFKTEERIECSFFITIDERNSTSFKATFQVQASRPIFGTNYKSALFMVNDAEVSFTYVDQQSLDFNINDYTSNLTSVLAFYTYVILGMDYDSFSKNGGDDYFQKALTVSTQAQSGGGSGWTSEDGDKRNNRFWLIENLTNSIYGSFHEAVYQYHRLGMDQMGKEKQAAENYIMQSLKQLEIIQQRQPSSYLLRVFFNGKADELVNIFSSADQGLKNAAVPLLIKINPDNTAKYNKILEAK